MLTGRSEGRVQQDLCHHLYQLQERFSDMDAGKIRQTLPKLQHTGHLEDCKFNFFVVLLFLSKVHVHVCVVESEKEG